MNRNAYLTIVILLSAAVLGFLLVQVYWLNSAYTNKEQEFNKVVYEVMDEIGIKIQNRSDLASLKLNYVIDNGDTLVKTPARNKIIIKTDEHINISLHNDSDAKVSVLKTIEHKKSRDTLIVRKLGKNSRIEFKTTVDDTVPKMLPPIHSEKQLKNIMQKLMSEVIVIDTESEDPDTLAALVSRSFKARGISLPFAFSFEKTGEQNKLLARSKEFDSTAHYFVSDLSAKLLLPSHRLLKLQFPQLQRYLFGKMKSAMLLSIGFSLVIVVVMIFVVLTIRKQKQLSELRNDFVNNMTHELKTPIATVSIALSALEKEQIKNDTEKTALYHRILKEENEKMKQHVERVLQLSLLEKGKVNLQFEVCDLNSIVQKSISNFLLRAQEQKSEIIFSKAEVPLTVNGDAIQLELAINNIIDNALKYGGAGAAIRIETVMHENTAQLFISDEGIGISKVQQQQIFERFFRVQGGDVHDVKGFGLGLSFVKQIIDMHRGEVSCESAIGKGSTFIIKLPVYA